MTRVWFFTSYGKVRNKVFKELPKEGIDDSAKEFPGQYYSNKVIARSKRNQWLSIAVPEVEKQVAALETVRKKGRRKLRQLRKLLERVKKQERGEYANNGERTLSSGRVR